MLASLCVLVGALLFGGGVLAAGEGSLAFFLLVAAVFAAASVLAQSALPAVLSVLALSCALGARRGYLDDSYFLRIEEPTLTVTLFTLLLVAAYQLSKRLPIDRRPLPSPLPAPGFSSSTSVSGSVRCGGIGSKMVTSSSRPRSLPFSGRLH